jgi:hypothetical protein
MRFMSGLQKVRFGQAGVLLAAALGLISIHDVKAQGIDGVWSGRDTNGFYGDETLSIKLTTNGDGVFLGDDHVAIPGTFTYTIVEERIVYVSNDTASLTGTLRYDASSGALIYQESAKVAKQVRESRGPVVLLRDTNELGNAMLSSMVGATNSIDVMKRLGGFLATLTNGVKSTSERTAVLKGRLTGTEANGSQPAQLETNSTPLPNGSGR